MTQHTLGGEPTRVAILGLGSMGRAILTGLLDPAAMLNAEIRVTNQSAEKAAMWDDVERVTAFAVELLDDANQSAVRDADVVILAVKPWQIIPLLDEIAPVLHASAVVVSIAAGVTLEAMQAHLPEHTSVIRAMPNTPALIGRGVTGLSAGGGTSAEHLALVTRLFEEVGDVVVVPHEQIDALSAVSGSGPAYVFFMAERMMDAAVAIGLSAEDSRALVVGTFAGAAELLARSGEDARELRRRVTSPKGTTEQAIAVLDAGQLDQLFEQALRAAMNRAAEIAAENS